MSNKSWAVAMMIPLAAASALATAPAASAARAGVQKSGSCSAGTHWTMKAKPDNGRIELELEIDSNRNGQKWAVRINDNSHRIFTGYRFTHAPSGSFEIQKLTANRAGRDHFVGVAKNLRTGERCVARVNL